MKAVIEAVQAPTESLRAAIAAPLLAYNSSLAGASGHRSLALVLRDPAQPDAVLGGLWGATGHGWLYTQMLVVPGPLRGQGLGRQLMHQAHEQARARGCHHAWVDTQFGARGFYESLGYTLFGELPDYPPGFSRSFLSRAL